MTIPTKPKQRNTNARPQRKPLNPSARLRSPWSDREIARQCGVSNDFVSRLRRESLSSNDSETSGRTYTTRHGTCGWTAIASVTLRKRWVLLTKP